MGFKKCFYFFVSMIADFFLFPSKKKMDLLPVLELRASFQAYFESHWFTKFIHVLSFVRCERLLRMNAKITNYLKTHHFCYCYCYLETLYSDFVIFLLQIRDDYPYSLRVRVLDGVPPQILQGIPNIPFYEVQDQSMPVHHDDEEVVLGEYQVDTCAPCPYRLRNARPIKDRFAPMLPVDAFKF